MEEREIEESWSAHPLYPALPALRELLSDATTESAHMLVISDARGVLLWIEGYGRVIEATQDMHFVCGADWSEQGAGTNALGTAIAADHPVQIFSAEHFSRIAHPWQCSGAPIHDPDTGEILGVVDLTGHLKTAHPHTLSLVTAAARMAEAFLREQARLRDERARDTYLSRVVGKPQPTALVGRGGRVLMAVPHDWAPATVVVPRGGGELTLPDGQTAVAEPLAGGDAYVLWGRPRRAAAVLGGEAGPVHGPAALALELLRQRPVARLHGQPVELSLRHAELLCVLLFSPRGLTAEQLALELYGTRGKAVTVRAELSRLRRLLGGVLQARPYGLIGDVRADVVELQRDLASAEPGELLDRYAQPLLADSTVPIVVEARGSLDNEVRRRVMTSGDPELLLRWCRSSSGEHDQPAAELLLSLVQEGDPRRAVAEARVTRLRAMFP
jgi:hypothetical protein